MLGLARKQARERFDEIIAFAELEEFVDLKLKNYSSGHERAARRSRSRSRSTPTCCSSTRCSRSATPPSSTSATSEFERLKAEGKTIVFVTHDMSAVERFCDRAMLIEKGDVVSIGAPREGRAPTTSSTSAGIVHADVEGGRHGDRSPRRSRAAWFENAAWQRSTTMSQGHFCHACSRSSSSRTWRTRSSAGRCTTSRA